ncbi:MAG: hypothetical protein ACP6KW_11865 [Candidatus Thorarchaeota archaeon]
MTTILQLLKDAPAMSIAGIAQATGIDRRTVSKALDLILKVQESLANKKIEKERIGRMWVISLKKRTIDLLESAKTKVTK